MIQWLNFVRQWHLKTRYANRGVSSVFSEQSNLLPANVKVPSAILFLEMIENYFVWPQHQEHLHIHYNSAKCKCNISSFSVSDEEEKEGVQKLQDFIDVLHHKADEENDGGAQCVLGKMYDEGMVTGKSEGATAVAYYTKAADQQGHHVGLGLLADAYDKGKF